VLIPRAGGVLSALGLAISDLRRDYVSPFLSDLEEVEEEEFEQRFGEMEKTAAGDLDGPEHTRRADLRYGGQSFEITVDAGSFGKLEDRFHTAHEQRYGYRMDDEKVELVNVRLISTVPVEKPELNEPEPEGDAQDGKRDANYDGEWRGVAVLDRERMGEGSEVAGPAIVEFKESTCVVRPGWRGTVDGVGTLVLVKE
jgi:N-methylhydantoinase A